MPSPFGAKNTSFVAASILAKYSFCLRPASTVNLYDLPGVAGPAARSPTGVSNTPVLVYCLLGATFSRVTVNVSLTVAAPPSPPMPPEPALSSVPLPASPAPPGVSLPALPPLPALPEPALPDAPAVFFPPEPPPPFVLPLESSSVLEQAARSADAAQNTTARFLSFIRPSRDKVMVLR